MSKTPRESKKEGITPMNKSWREDMRKVEKNREKDEVGKPCREVTNEGTALASSLVNSSKSERTRNTTASSRVAPRSNSEKKTKATRGSGAKRERPVWGGSNPDCPVNRVAKEEPEATMTSNSSKPAKRAKTHWEGKWCKDEAILARRTKDIEKAMEKPIYKQYLAMIPKGARLPIHPRTPNKHVNVSRRAWDSQIKYWKKSLYKVCDEAADLKVGGDGLNTATDEEGQNPDKEPLPGKLKDIVIRPAANALDRLLGGLDMTTRSSGERAKNTATRGGESAKKATARSSGEIAKKAPKTAAVSKEPLVFPDVC